MTALLYAATVVIGAVWIVAFVGAVAVLLEGLHRLAGAHRRGLERVRRAAGS